MNVHMRMAMHLMARNEPCSDSFVAGVQLSLEYISDYVKICGLRLYQEGMHRVIGFYVEQASH